MPIIKRLNKYQGLKDIDVLVEEKGRFSDYFNVEGIPRQIPQGKSSFLVGGSAFLKNNIEIKIEMIDSKGKTVYMEPVSNYIEGDARRVSIEVYPDTAPGRGTLYIVAELKRNYKSFSTTPDPSEDITDNPFTPTINSETADVPPEFQGVYNVRFARPIRINTSITNTEPILFYKQPRLTVNEVVKGFVTETIPSASYQVSGTLSVNPIPDPPTEPAPAEPEDGQPVGMTESDREDVGKSLAIFKNRRSKKRDPYRSTLFGKRGRKMRRSSPEIDKSTGIILTANTTPETAENTIHSGFVGADITFTNITSDVSSLGGQPYDFSTTFTTKVKKVINGTTFVPMDDYKVTLMNGEKVQVPITSATFSASIAPTPGFSISTTNFRSFADITVGNLRTFSGDVYKAKVYGKSKGSLGDFEPMYDAFIESSEVLIDKLSPTGFSSTAYFYTQSIVDAYWNISNGTAVESDDVLIDGVTISGSNYEASQSVNFTTKHLYDLEPNVAYNVEFNTYFYKADKVQESGNVKSEARMEVYVTGSKAGNKELLGIVDVGEGSEGKIDSIFKTFISSNITTPKMALEFHVKAGRFILQDLSVRPTSETNFNPDYHRVIVPMEHPLPVKPDNYDFVVEFFDVNNNIAETFAVTENVEFDGAPLVIAGTGNVLSGSMLLGTGMELYGGSAFLRTVGYTGFDNTLANNKGGFMVFSGSIGGPSATENLISSSEDYDGVGLEIIDAHTANNPRYLRFGTNPSRFEVVTDTFYFGKNRTQSNAQFVSGSNGQIEISSSNFHVSPSGDVKMSGTVTATAGKIAGWNIIGNVLSGSNATLDAAGAALFMSNKGPGSDDSAAFDQLRDEYYIDFTPADQENTTNYHIKMGPNFAVDSDGVLFASGAKFVGTITASAGLIGGWAIEDDYMGSVPDGLRLYGNTSASPYHISSSEFQVTNTGQITGSSVLFSGGRIANWDIIGDTLSSVNASGKGIVIDADASTPIIEIREDDNNRIQIYHTTTSDWGIIGRSDSTNIFRLGSTNQIAGWNFTNERLSSFSTATQDKFGISIDSDYQLITIHGNAGDGKNNVGANDRDNVVLAIGQTNTAGQYGIKGWNTTGDRVFELSTERTEIAGWTLDNESLIGGEMIIRKDGTIESSGFASDVAGSGFRLTAASGGFLEVENARIRGTLSTAVFEKESVNAVGGQLYVANSTVLTGSLRYPDGVHTAAQTTMSVVNSSGFVSGEILTIKKVHNTGFNTEYLLVASSSRVSASSETDFTGHLYVTRGYGQGVNGDSGSLGGVAGSATHYSGSQVVVSTGRIGTGYIRLNANPSDQATPYIDIVERTGSGLYDINLQARLGDLSGLSSARLHGTNPAGQYGLYSKNVFLEGGIVANTGSIAGIEMQDGKLYTGTGTHGNANTGFFASSSGDFSLKDKLVWDNSAGTLTLKGALRQTPGGQTIVDYVDRGTWSSGTSYAENDLVQYTGTTTSTYKCINAHTSTNDTSNTTGRPDVNNGSGTSGWATYAAGGVDGTPGATGATGNTGPSGAAAKGLSVTLESQTFAFDDSSDTSSTPTSILFSINQQNLSGTVTTSDITITDAAGSTVTNPTLLTSVTNGTGTVSGSLEFSSNLSGDKSKLPVTVSVSKDSITDSATIFKIEGGSDGAAGADGTDAYTPILTNESHVVGRASTQAGGAYNLTDSGTEIIVFRGITGLTGSLSSPITGTYSASIVENNFTAGTPTIVNNKISFADMTANPTDVTGSITYTIHAEGSASFTKIQSLSVNQSADSGSDGTNGTSPANLSISTSTQVFAFDDSSDTSPDPTTATITATQANQASNLEDGDLSVTNGTKGSFSYSGTSGTGTATWTVTPSGTYPITATISNDSLSDSIQMHKIVGGADGDPGAAGADGEDAFTIILSNESHIVPQNSTQAGSAFNFLGSGTNITVFKGLTALTGITSGSPTSTQYLIAKTANGVTVADPTGGNPSTSPNISALSAGSGSITFTITPSGSGAFTRIQSFTKSQAADSGSDGSSAKSIRLSADAQSFITNDTSMTPATITFTANRQNISSATTFSSSPTVTLGGSGDIATLTSASFGNNTAVTITATADSISDSITIVKLVEGSDGFTVLLSNESHNVTQASPQAGSAHDFTGSGTNITVFKGTVQQAGIVSGTTNAGQFLVSKTQTGVTSATPQAGTPVTVGNLTGMSADIGNITYTVTPHGSSAFTKIQSFTRTTAADSGSDGDTGPQGPDGIPGVTGSTGAGVSFTGPWESGKAYNGGSAIKDVVKYGSSYYVATSNHTSTDNTNSSTGRPGDGGPWETFGAQFSSVATDILLAQDSTITRGLVMGSADPASSTGGAFIRSISKTALGTNSGDGFFLSSSGDFSFEKVNDSRVQMDSDGIEISSSKFHLKDDGDLIVRKVNATEGSVGGWDIGSTLSKTNILLDPATPKITLGTKATLTDANAGLYLGTDGIALGASSVFKVTSAGAITAHSGDIGGFTLAASTLSTPSMSLDSSNQKLVFRDTNNDYLTITTETNSFSKTGLSTDAADVTTAYIKQLTGTDLIILQGDADRQTFVGPGRFRAAYTHTTADDTLDDGIQEGAIEGRTANYRGDLSATIASDNINAGVLGINNRGGAGGLKVGIYGRCNDHWSSVGILGEGKYRADYKSSSWSGVFRYRPFVVGDPFEGGNGLTGYSEGRLHSSDSATLSSHRWDDRPDGEYATLMVLPYNARSAHTHSDALRGRVGIRTWLPGYELDVSGTIRATGNVIAYSDIRKKENIVRIENGLSLVEQLRGVRFDWKEGFQQDSNTDKGKRQIGVIAQEVEKILPEVVSTDSEGYKSVNYPTLTAVLIESVKDLKQIVDKQQKQIDELKRTVGVKSDNK